MWFRSSSLLLILCCAGALAPAWAQEPVRPKYVVLITIDGMRPEMVVDPTMPAPTLRQIAAEGVIDSLQMYATGYLSSQSFNARTRNREGRTAYMASYIFEAYRPRLTTIHFIGTDSYQHATGTASNETKMAVAAVDYGVNQGIEGLTRAEATMFLYLKDPRDAEAVELVRQKLASLPESKRAMFRLVERAELAALGCDPRVELAVEPVYGVAVATNASGADVVERFGGKHGYLLPIDPTTLVAAGPGIPEGRTVPHLSVTDVAPFVMHLLGVDFDAPTAR